MEAPLGSRHGYDDTQLALGSRCTLHYWGVWDKLVILRILAARDPRQPIYYVNYQTHLQLLASVKRQFLSVLL